jgi:hypothetical protein
VRAKACKNSFSACFLPANRLLLFIADNVQNHIYMTAFLGNLLATLWQLIFHIFGQIHRLVTVITVA